jgi:hypothetical protein
LNESLLLKSGAYIKYVSIFKRRLSFKMRQIWLFDERSEYLLKLLILSEESNSFSNSHKLLSVILDNLITKEGALLPGEIKILLDSIPLAISNGNI